MIETAQATASSLVGSVGLQSSWDIVILVLFLIGSIAYGFFLGRERIVTIMVSIYVSLAVVVFFPYFGLLSEVKIQSTPYIRVAIFLAIVCALYFLLSRSDILKVGDGKIIETSIVSILQVGLLLSFALFLIPDTFITSLPGVIKSIFISDIGRFVWASAPVIALIFIRDK